MSDESKSKSAWPQGERHPLKDEPSPLEVVHDKSDRIVTFHGRNEDGDTVAERVATQSGHEWVTFTCDSCGFPFQRRVPSKMRRFILRWFPSGPHFCLLCLESE